eukprot:4563438-Pyramimonas_sp.AAC.1
MTRKTTPSAPLAAHAARALLLAAHSAACLPVAPRMRRDRPRVRGSSSRHRRCTPGKLFLPRPARA